MTSGVKLDWLRVRFPSAYLVQVADELERLGLGKPETRSKGIWWYDASQRYECGALVAWTPDRADACLELQGKACDILGPDKLLELVKFLHKIGGVGRRVDAAFDDFDSLIPMEDVHDCGRRGGYLGFRKYRDMREWDLGTLTGDTAYFGRRGENGSGKFVRIYDKALEMAARETGEPCPDNWKRLEVEHSGDVAHQVFCDLVACEDVQQLAGVIGRACGGAIVFVDRGTHVHADRMEVLPWWSALHSLLGSFKYRAVRVPTKMAQLVRWVRRQVSKPLAMLVAAAEENGSGLGSQVLRSLVGLGADKCLKSELEGRGKDLTKWMLRDLLAGLGSCGGGLGLGAQRAGAGAAPF